MRSKTSHEGGQRHEPDRCADTVGRLDPFHSLGAVTVMPLVSLWRPLSD
jgi:hypothetical protein